MAIINYYEKYGFSQTDELEKTQWVINQKITDEENDPFGEGHSDKMFILQLAKEAFATVESRAKYDQELADSQKKSDPDGERKASFSKWYGDAKIYYDSKQYDLAKTAIDRAMQFATPETVDSAFYDTAACIYHSLKLPQALDLENQSIVLSPEEANGYYLKSYFLYTYIFEENLGHNKMQDIWQQLKSNCELTISKVIAREQGYAQASKCYEYLAEMHYVYINGHQFPVSGQNNVLAEEYALKAISILNASSSYYCFTAKKILDDIAARRRKVAELEEANANLRAKLKEDNDVLERKNLVLKIIISSQKSSINNATTFGSTNFGVAIIWVCISAAIMGIPSFCIAIWASIMAATTGINLSSSIASSIASSGVVGGVLIFFPIAILIIKGRTIAMNKKIRDTLEKIRKTQAELDSNTYKISSNKNNTDSQIRNNNNIIAQQSAGLTPKPLN